MKQCPVCRTTYTDDSLTYCLADGNVLVYAETEAETEVRRGMRVDIEDTQPKATPLPHEFVAPAKSSGSPVLKVVVGVLILGILGLLIVAGAGMFYYFITASTNVSPATPTPKPTPALSPTVDVEKERLQKELANLQKQLENDKNSEKKDGPFPPDTDGMPKATVNSPNDGFLALRSEPNAETGARLAQIPHGTIVALENCEKEKVKIGERTGRWCMVTYRGITGWVFDAWLTY